MNALYDIYQISPTYVIIGASIRPTPNPIIAIAIKTISAELAYARSAQPMKCGILNRIMALFRPIGSENQPDMTHPMG